MNGSFIPTAQLVHPRKPHGTVLDEYTFRGSGHLLVFFSLQIVPEMETLFLENQFEVCVSTLSCAHCFH